MRQLPDVSVGSKNNATWAKDEGGKMEPSRRRKRSRRAAS
jgi:hypothetical protein